MRAAALRRLFAIGLWLAVPLAQAASREAEPPPNTELLEFLGSWETEDGRAVDPFEMEDMSQFEPDSRTKEPAEGDMPGDARRERREQPATGRKPNGGSQGRTGAHE